MNRYMESNPEFQEKYSNHFSGSYVGPINIGGGFNSSLEKVAKYVPPRIKPPVSNYNATVSPMPQESNYSESPIEKMFDYRSPASPKYKKPGEDESVEEKYKSPEEKQRIGK